MKPQEGRYYTITPTRDNAKLKPGRYFISRVTWSISLGDMFQIDNDNQHWLATSYYDFKEVTMTIERNKYHLVVPTSKEAMIKEGIYRITWASAGEFMIEGSPVYHNPNLYEIKPVGEEEMARALNLMEKRLHEVEQQNAEFAGRDRQQVATIQAIAIEREQAQRELHATKTRLQEQRATTVFYEAENRSLAGSILVLTKQAIPELNDRIVMLQREVALMNQAGAARQREHSALQMAYAAAVDLIEALKQKVVQLSVQNTYLERLAGRVCLENVQVKEGAKELAQKTAELMAGNLNLRLQISTLEEELVSAAEDLADMAEFVDQIQQLAQVVGIVGTVVDQEIDETEDPQ